MDRNFLRINFLICFSLVLKAFSHYSYIYVVLFLVLHVGKLFRITNRKDYIQHTAQRTQCNTTRL